MGMLNHQPQGRRRWTCFLKALFAMAVFALTTVPTLACTSFCVQKKDQVLFAKNLDWYVPDGMLVTNKRGIDKTALLIAKKDRAARWTSKYGSISFNMHGREYPLGGMNEKGLAIETLWLNATQYPKVDQREALSILSWVQYHLDTCATAKEVLECQKKIRIAPQYRGQVHFIVCDATGQCVTVEFLKGRVVTHLLDKSHAQVLANRTYAQSSRLLGQCKGFGGSKEVNGGFRFGQVASRVKTFDPETKADIYDYALKTLDSARQGSTVWQIVYDLTNREIRFRTRSHEPLRTLKLQSINFASTTPVKILDINAQYAGDVAKRFTPYTTEANRQLVKKVASRTTFMKNIPDALLERIALYPESELCQPAKE